MLTEYYGDFHIHIGRTQDGHPVKVTAARTQTLPLVFKEAVTGKGLDIVGIVDAACPRLCAELSEMVLQGEARELPGGGLRYRECLTVIPGAEIEATEENGGRAHWLAYFPLLEQLCDFSRFLSCHLTNPELSTQSSRLPARVILDEVLACGGIFMPAHAFTPHKGVYGQVTHRLEDLFGKDRLKTIIALELGLSADTAMADHLAETAGLTYLSNSDAHSLKNLGREFNVLLLAEPDWNEILKALSHREGRRIAANYGLDPRLGKYHRTFCLSCQRITAEEPPVLTCPACGSRHVVRGVHDRIREIGDWPEPRHPVHRPPYSYQVPLGFLPGIGPKTIRKLLTRFGSEITILHRTPRQELADAIGAKLADVICRARGGNLKISAGGGGTYGKVSTDVS